MDTSAQALAIETSHVLVPTWVRGVLWTAIGLSILMALGIGVLLLAGNNSKPSALWRYFLCGFGAALLVQSGYLAAPFAIGRSWWLWAFIGMMPAVIMILLALSVPVIGAMKWTRPDGASGWKTIANIGWFTTISAVMYCTPPVLMWIYRPTTGK